MSAKGFYFEERIYRIALKIKWCKMFGMHFMLFYICKG